MVVFLDNKTRKSVSLKHVFWVFFICTRLHWPFLSGSIVLDLPSWLVDEYEYLPNARVPSFVFHICAVLAPFLSGQSRSMPSQMRAAGVGKLFYLFPWLFKIIQSFSREDRGSVISFFFPIISSSIALWLISSRRLVSPLCPFWIQNRMSSYPAAKSRRNWKKRKQYEFVPSCPAPQIQVPSYLHIGTPPLPSILSVPYITPLPVSLYHTDFGAFDTLLSTLAVLCFKILDMLDWRMDKFHTTTDQQSWTTVPLALLHLWIPPSFEIYYFIG